MKIELVNNSNFKCDEAAILSVAKYSLKKMGVHPDSELGIRFVNEDELPFALTSQLRTVSTSKPIAKDTSGGFQLYPQSTQTGFYNYLRRPNAPVLGYTQTGRTITYDPNTSTQLEFTDVYINNIIARALKFWGINMAEQDIQQFAQLQTQETK